MELFNNLRESMLEIEHIQQKVDQLKIYQQLPNLSNIKIIFDSGSKTYSMIQLDTDISLVNELKMLIQASIEIYEQQILDLKLNF
jgi:hypothetical protein